MVVLGIGILASVVPARRATRVNPIVAMREAYRPRVEAGCV